MNADVDRAVEERSIDSYQRCCLNAFNNDY